MGFAIAGTYILNRPQVPNAAIPNASPLATLAFIKAVIDKTVLEDFADLQKLKAIYPDRVSLTANAVTLSGPVLVIPNRVSLLVIKIALPVITCFSVSLGTYLHARTLVPQFFVSKRPLTAATFDDRKKQEKMAGILAAVGSLLAGCLAAAAVSFFIQKKLSAGPGIYFY